MTHRTLRVRVTALAWISLAAAALVGCSADGFTSATDAAADSVADAAVDVADAAPDVAVKDVSVDAPIGIDGGPCVDNTTPIDEVVGPNADTVIFTGSSQNFGGLAVANVGESLGSAALLRFTVSSAAVSAFVANRALRVTLTLTRAAIDQPNCGGPCPAAAGTLLAAPLTTTIWTESGASWMTKNGSAAWAGAGASASGDIASSNVTAAVTASQPKVAFVLPASAFAGFVGANAIALRVSPSAGATFVLATKENTTYAKPSATVTYCP